MNDDFVPFELAEKLKEKGFRMPCIAHYCCLDGNVLKFNITTDCIRGSNVKCLNGENNIYTDAPTISQVLKWLREEKKIVISTFPHPCGWQADIYKDVHQYYDSEAECYLMYYHKEETEISYSYNWLEIYCIKYVLDNLI